MNLSALFPETYFRLLGVLKGRVGRGSGREEATDWGIENELIDR